jgi:hypothetical protein
MSGTHKHISLTERLLPCPLTLSGDPHHWSNHPVPAVWSVALRMLPGLHLLTTERFLTFMNRRFSLATQKSYAITWKYFIGWANIKCAVKPLSWFVLLTNLLTIHQDFVFDHTNFKAYHLTRITPVLNGTREHVFLNCGIAEAVIRAQRTTSTTPKYKVSQCIRPILSWARIVHADLAGLRLRLIIILKLESLRQSDDLFNILRSQIIFSNRGVSFRIFQPKEIKGSLGIFGPPIYPFQHKISTVLHPHIAARVSHRNY